MGVIGRLVGLLAKILMFLSNLPPKIGECTYFTKTIKYIIEEG